VWQISPAASIERFVGRWKRYETDGVVTLENFLLYYHDQSLALAADTLFIRLLRASWGMA
jgi:hypothetical protein